MGGLKTADTIAVCTCICTFHVAEKLTFQNIFIQGCTIHFNK